MRTGQSIHVGTVNKHSAPYNSPNFNLILSLFSFSVGYQVHAWSYMIIVKYKEYSDNRRDQRKIQEAKSSRNYVRLYNKIVK